ncbi:hypothetical protein TELCIR_09642, partial [Teladorsagia circumcincta]
MFNHLRTSKAELAKAPSKPVKKSTTPGIISSSLPKSQCPSAVTPQLDEPRSDPLYLTCSTAPCQRNGVAKQRRHVRCLKSNGEAVEEERCDKTQRPKTRKECENPSCKAEWHASDWGSCSSNCGTGGVQ